MQAQENSMMSSGGAIKNHTLIPVKGPILRSYDLKTVQNFLDLEDAYESVIEERNNVGDNIVALPLRHRV